jgi:2,3-bisphosphoglycerate-dependent phosphoglycerate mutase
MVRSFVTAVHIAQALDLPLTVWKDLHELGGIYLDDPASGEPVGMPGKPSDYFLESYEYTQFMDPPEPDGWWNRPFEEEYERSQRAERVLARLLALHGDTEDSVALVSHAGLYTFLMRELVGSHERRDLYFILENVGISRIKFEQGRVLLVYANRTDFLPDSLHT